MMDINDVRALVMVVAFTVFIAIVLWAYSERSKAGFDQAAQLPFDEDDDGSGTGERK